MQVLLLHLITKSGCLNQRFYSLDVFRGATVCLMILVNNPGSWSHIYGPLEHAPWHGLTPTDLVFPFFLFAVGNAMAFVMPKLEAAGDAIFWKKILKRTAWIFFIGLFLNWWPFVTEVNRLAEGATEFHQVTIFKGFTWMDLTKDKAGNIVEIIRGVRIMGVLQRIALCYFFASVIIYYFKARKAFYIGLIFLLVYWILCLAGNQDDPYSLSGWFGTGIDKRILGEIHMYKGEGVFFDPEGLMSTLPAIVQVIFGYLVGNYIQKKSKLPEQQQFDFEKPDYRSNGIYQMLSGLFVIAVALLVTGYCWDMAFPINKKIWTSSYTIYTSGLAAMTIATMIYMTEVKNIRGGLASFFDVFGKNALFVFALSAFLPKGLALVKLGDGTNPWNWLYKKLWVHVLPSVPEAGSLLYALCVISFMWLVCYVMDKKKIYIKV
jgi:predicted acyltransferase